MPIQISEMKVEDGYLLIKVPTSSLKDSQLTELLSANRNHEVTLSTQRRSRSANSYAWVLLHKLGEKLKTPPEEIYRHILHDLAIRREVFTMLSVAVQEFIDEFTRGYIGRFVEIIDDDGIYATVSVSYGSSSFDRREMRKFLNEVVAECKELGIETREPQYIFSLLEEWKR